MERLGLLEHLDVVVSGSDDLSSYTDKEGTNKPKPYVYLEAAKRLGVHPEECVAIEDSRNGVTAAVKAGYFTIAIPNHYTKSQDLSHADIQLESLEMTTEGFFEMIEEKKKVLAIPQ